MSRPMNPAEQCQFKQWFPNLNVDTAVVTGEATSAYNCIAWTLGVTTRNIPSGESWSLANFDVLYQNYGFDVASNGPIVLYSISSQITHGSISGPGHGPRWESKCGVSLRIQHGIHELEGSSYGQAGIRYYRQVSAPTPAFAAMLKKIMKQKPVKSYLSTSQRKILAEQINQISPELRMAYHTAFDHWKATWYRGLQAISSNPFTRTFGDEYGALIALGPAIIPLVVESLADPENSMALQLYDAIQSKPRLRIQYEPGDERILEGEEGRAQRTVQAWFVNS